MTDNESLRGWLDAALEGAYRDGAEQERAAVVAWLRSREGGPIAQGTLNYAADGIERGEHRREEEP
jgi:hypothetical protein